MVTTYQRMGKNFVTPDVIEYEYIGDRVVELSEGVGLSGEKVYGVSEFVYENSRLESTKRGKMFRDREEAHKYYSTLKIL